MLLIPCQYPINRVFDRLILFGYSLQMMKILCDETARVAQGSSLHRQCCCHKVFGGPKDSLAAAGTPGRMQLTCLECSQIDDAFQGTDREAVEMAQYLLRNDGLFVGSSAAMNCVGAVKAARMLGPGHTIVTVLCDGGHRHLSKFHNQKYLAQCGLSPEHEGKELAFVL